MPDGIRGHLAAKLGIPPHNAPFTDAQLSEFANYSGNGGTGATLQDLNRKLLQSGMIDTNSDYASSTAAPISGNGFEANKNGNSIVPVMAVRALMQAKKLGIKNADEFIANAGNIFTDPLHKQLLGDKAFNHVYPNLLQTIAKVYVNRNNEYKPTP